MRRWSLLVLLGLLMLLIGMACSSAPAAPTPAPAKPAAAPTKAPAATEKPAASGGPSQELVNAAKAEGKVVIYTGSPREYIELAASEFTKKYGIQVEFSRKGGPEIISLVDAEHRAGKVKADILQHGDATQANLWAQQGILVKYQPESAQFLSKEARDPNGVWVPHIIYLCTQMINTKIPKEKWPKTYKELTDPKWKGRLTTVRPRGSGTGSVFVSVLVSTYGWEYFEALAKNDPLLLRSVSGLPQIVINGEADVLFPENEEVAYPLVKKGEPIAFIHPTDVIPVGMNISGLTKDATHPNAGKLFMDFVLREDLQAVMAKELGMRPSNVNAPAPEGLPPIKDLKLKPGDPEWMAKNLNEMNDKYDQIFMGAKSKQ